MRVSRGMEKKPTFDKYLKELANEVTEKNDLI